jgi:uncharacterized protein (TIGR03545 family)
MEDNKEEKVKKKKKKGGPIRYEAILPVFILSLLTFLYFTYYFDRHVKGIIEYAGTQINGAEVNVDSLDISFIKGSFDLNRLEVTDKELPKRNSLEIGNIHFQFLWDALLRMKFVVDDASITNVQLNKPRRSPGKVLPPKPAKPGKIEELQNQVMAQVKNKYGANVLGDALALLEGQDVEGQIEKIRGELKSEARAEAMVKEVTEKRKSWDERIKNLSNTSKLKEIEAEVQKISKQKNVLQQAQAVKNLNDLLKEVEDQYEDVEKATKDLKSDVAAVTEYPKELQALINQDIASLKNRFSIPQLDFKDMAMHLFAGQFADYIAKARKYHAVSKEYMPTKKEDKEEIVPRQRSEGKTYLFPVTTGYPLFWLKRAAISSQGTAESYSGNVSGELTNVTTAPKQIKKPMLLDMQGNFPTAEIMGVRALVTVDHTKKLPKESAMIQVNSFKVPEKMFVSNEKLKLGFLNAVGASTINANMVGGKINMDWTSSLTKPNFLVETSSQEAKKILTNILNDIPVINIKGNATGSFTDLKMNLSSNLGEELGAGLKRELSQKLTAAQTKLNNLVEERVNKPKEELLAEVGATRQNLSQLGNLQELYKKHEKQIENEIQKVKKGGLKDLESQGKKLLKGIKFR